MNPMPNKIYNILKYVAMIVLPALATLVITLGGVWDFSHTNEMATSITAVNAFLGALVGISSKTYHNSDDKYDGAIVTDVTDAGTKIFSLELNNTPEEIENMDSILFKVVGPRPPQ